MFISFSSLSINFLGSAGQKRLLKSKKEPIVACSIVINKIIANFVKNSTLQKSITTPAANVVNAAARIEGPM